MVQYVLQKTVVKHSDSINALAFTYDGSLFASGADDGVIIVFKGNGHGEEVRRFQMKAPITTLLWHSRFGHTVIAGDACGDVHTICLNNSVDVSASLFCVYGDIDEISFTEKHQLPYF
jgi:WD40 repeat protein